LPTLLTDAKPLSATTVWDKRESFRNTATNGGNGSKFPTECSAAKDEEPVTKARHEKRREYALILYLQSSTGSGRPDICGQAASGICVTGTRRYRSRSIEDYFP
jgi:hypothetical protein